MGIYVRIAFKIWFTCVCMKYHRHPFFCHVFGGLYFLPLSPFLFFFFFLLLYAFSVHLIGHILTFFFFVRKICSYKLFSFFLLLINKKQQRWKRERREGKRGYACWTVLTKEILNIMPIDIRCQ
jgi:hypothetical protein